MESTNLAALAVAILACSCSLVLSQEGPCTTPDRQRGECIPLNSCEAIRALTQQRPLPASTIELLRRLRCGFVGNTPYVCCASAGSTNTGTGGGGTRPNTDDLFGLGGGDRLGNNGGGPVSATNINNHRNLRLIPREVCGVDVADRIIGGEEARLKEYPWLALLEYQTNSGRQFLCGGVLISNRYVVTAAHCIRGIGNVRFIGVRLGEHNIDTNPDCQATDSGEVCGDPVQDFGVAEDIPHPQYSPQSRDKQNDIALVRLDRQVTFSDYIAPICLPAGEALTKTYAQNRLTVAGWGKTENRSSSNVKLWVNVPVMTNAQCAPIYSRQLTLTANQMCAGGVKGKDSCRGDSGGPLMSTENVVSSRPGAQWVAAGIVSIGPAICGAEGRPGIYTRVAPYVSWILDTIKP